MDLEEESFERLASCNVVALSDAFYHSRPNWIVGQISQLDARFLFRAVVLACPEIVVEIGTATGLSAAHLCYALDVLNQAQLIPPNFRIATYDISRTWQPDPSRKIGDGAREFLAPQLLDRIFFRNPALAADAARDFPVNSIRFAFIDANHGHPWPTLDLLALLDCLAVGATVVMHDINLPIIKPESDVWGAKYLFDSLSRFGGSVPNDAGRVPNIGSIVIPSDKFTFREKIFDVLRAHPWQSKVSNEYLKRIGLGEFSS